MVWMYHPDYEPVNIEQRHEVRDAEGNVIMVVNTSLEGDDGVPFATLSDEDGERMHAAWVANARARVQAEIDVQHASVLAAYDDRVARYKRIGWTDEDILAEIGPAPEKMEYTP